MLGKLAPGDVVTVTQFRSLAEPWADTGTSTGPLMSAVLGGLAWSAMRMRLIGLIPLTALLASVPSPAHAQMQSALDVYYGCRLVADSPASNDRISIPPDYAASFCLGAFTAIIGLSGISSGGGAQNFLHFCPPSGATGVQYIRIFLKYVDDHPENGHEIFPIVALNALIHAFPCKR